MAIENMSCGCTFDDAIVDPVSVCQRHTKWKRSIVEKAALIVFRAAYVDPTDFASPKQRIEAIAEQLFEELGAGRG